MFTRINTNYLSLFLYAILIGQVGIFARFVNGLDTITIVFYRASSAALFLLLIRLGWEGWRSMLPRRWSKILLVGLLQAAMMICYVGAARRTSIANTVFLTYTAPLFSVFFAWAFLKERVHRNTWYGLAVALLGVFFLAGPKIFTRVQSVNHGDLLALGAGLSYAAMTVAAKPLSNQLSGPSLAFGQQLVVALMVLPFVDLSRPDLVLANWWPLAGIGILCTGVGFLCFMHGVRRVPTQHVLIVTSLEPVAGTLVAALALGEAIPRLTLTGGLLILLGAFFVIPTELSPVTIT